MSSKVCWHLNFVYGLFTFLIVYAVMLHSSCIWWTVKHCHFQGLHWDLVYNSKLTQSGWDGPTRKDAFEINAKSIYCSICFSSLTIAISHGMMTNHTSSNRIMILCYTSLLYYWKGQCKILLTSTVTELAFQICHVLWIESSTSAFFHAQSPIFVVVSSTWTIKSLYSLLDLPTGRVQPGPGL